MKRKNVTRSALVTSIISLLLCVSMLVGTTFAWFTDSVVSGNNVIAAGNLDVELAYSDKDESGYVDVSTELFNDVQLWEPGAVAYVNFVVENVGTLALKYQMSVNFANETVVNGHGLSEALKVAVVEGGFSGDRAAAQALTNLAPLSSFVLDGVLEGATKSETYGLVIYWEPTENDNWFNMNNENKGQKLTIDLGVNLFATQEMYEEDSFGEDYDEGAYLPTIYTEEELKSALENNASVQLGSDIVLTEWKPIGDKDAGIYFTGTLDGNGHTISGLNVASNDYDGFISAAKDATIKNLTVEGVVNGVNAAGIVARVEGNTVIENCVNNVTVTGSTKAGGIVCNVTGANVKIINCVNNADISGGDSGIGGIVGYVNNNAYLEIINCTNNGDVTGKYAGAAVGYGAQSKGLVVDFTNTGVITGTLAGGNRFLKDGDTVLVGYQGNPGNWQLGISNANSMIEALEGGMDIVLTEDVKIDRASLSNAYGTTGINVKGQTVDGGGNTLNINGAGGTWDSGICITAGTVKNITVTGSFRGIFIKNNEEKVVLENVTTTGTVYTISCDQGKGGGLEATNCNFYGWTSFAATIGNVKFVDCTFGAGSGYNYSRPYAPTEYVGCDFAEGHTVDNRAAVTFKNCTINGVPLTAENVASLVTNTAKATVQ